MGTATIPGDIPLANLVVSPSGGLTEGTTSVTVSYMENDAVVSATVAVTVRTTTLTITSPTKTSYNWGESFNTAGLVVKNSSGTTISTYTMKIGSVTITNGTALNNSAFVIGNNTVDVSYTDSDGITQTGIFTISLAKVKLTLPQQSGTLTYSGSAQSPSWDSNYNSSLMTVTVTAQKDAGDNYSAIFSIRDTAHYEWSDGTTANKSQTWKIAKKTLAASDVTVTGTLSIDASNLTRTVTITTPTGETGTITITPMTVTGLTITAGTQTANSRQFTFKGNGSTALIQKFKVSVSAGKNYTAGDFADKFTISAQYWSFGAGTGEAADADWFNGLKSYLANNTGASLKTTSNGSIVGTTKTITLTSEVLGTTSHLIRVIGVDQDGANTVTFQTDNCLKNTTLWSTTAYSSSNTTAARWIDTACKAKAECLNYYKALPGYNSTTQKVPYIKTVKKGTVPLTNDSRNGTPDYNDETVFLCSEREMGLDNYSPLSTANSTTGKAECTQGYNAAYSYYVNGGSRVKKAGDSGSAQWYWERSRYYYSSSKRPTSVCIVDSIGSASSDYYGSSVGLAPAFVIG